MYSLLRFSLFDFLFVFPLRRKGPYGNFGKVEDFKVIESKTINKGKRTYR